MYTPAMTFLLGAMVVLAIYLPCRWWTERKCEHRIRQWADKHGYAIVRIARGASLRSSLPIVPLKSWQITIQDDEGGQRVGTVHFGHWLIDLPWGRMDIRWE